MGLHLSGGYDSNIEHGHREKLGLDLIMELECKGSSLAGLKFNSYVLRPVLSAFRGCIRPLEVSLWSFFAKPCRLPSRVSDVSMVTLAEAAETVTDPSSNALRFTSTFRTPLLLKHQAPNSWEPLLCCCTSEGSKGFFCSGVSVPPLIPLS